MGIQGTEQESSGSYMLLMPPAPNHYAKAYGLLYIVICNIYLRYYHLKITLENLLL